jgi:hypothetical protein
MTKYFMDHYIIFDIKTSDNNGENEIIELGAIKLNEKLEQIDTFHSNIKISIEQNCEFEPLIKVLPKFEDWIRNIQADYKFMYSWGRTQRNQIIEEAKRKNYVGEILNLLLCFSSLQHVFKNMKDNKLYTIEKAMKKIDIEYKKSQCLMDDIHNTANIFNTIYGKWIHPGIPVFPKPDEIIFTGEKYWLKQ